ncbi:hypothetical protein [Cognatilysobacter segetis]|uniref:hypothetical protein n=1 Tax=Cognatilysobacter segetis TaxID=2492394 RepID=UPI00105CC60C|nr:hypothetical protein [Lysobacter segetis]
MKLLLAFVIGATALLPAHAQETATAPGATAAVESAASAPADAPVAVAAAEPKVKKICRTERTVGSNRPKRICFTQEEMQTERDATRDAMLQGSRLRNNSTSGDL